MNLYLSTETELYFEKHYDEAIELLQQLCQIPAPSYKEEARAEFAALQNLEVIYTEDVNKSDGIVTAQSVQAGNIIKENEKVILTVNKQPKQSTVTVVLNLKALMNYEKPVLLANEVDTTKSSGKVEILIGEDIIFSETKSFEEIGITAQYTGSGVKTIKVRVYGITKSSNKQVDFNKGDQHIGIPN